MNKHVDTYIAYIDEFGHDGHFISVHHEKYKTSPVFGLAGFILPIHNARSFSTNFFKMKKTIFAQELAESTRIPAKWEKKGTEYFKTRSVEQKKVRDAFNRPLNVIVNQLDGHVFYVGARKNPLKEQPANEELYKETLKETIKRLNEFCVKKNAKLILCSDYNNNRAKMIEACGIEMFGFSKRTALLEPLFHAESHLYQTVQFADWIATIVGRCEAYRAKSDEFGHFQLYERYFYDRLKQVSIYNYIRAV